MLQNRFLRPSNLRHIITLPIMTKGHYSAFSYFAPIYRRLQAVESHALAVESYAHCTNIYLWYSLQLFVRIVLMHSALVGIIT